MGSDSRLTDPIAGAPQCPYIRTQSPNRFTMLALTSAKVTGFTISTACAYRLKAVNRKSGAMIQVNAFRKGTSNAITCGFVPTSRNRYGVDQIAAPSNGAMNRASQTPFRSVCRQSVGSFAPKDCATSVSIPSRVPVPNAAMG